MKRRLFTALSVLSLLLCVATVALWVRSYPDSNLWREVSYGSKWQVESLHGAIHFVYLAPVDELRNLMTVSHSFLGFGFFRQSSPQRLLILAISVPHWSLALLFAVLPALHVRSTIRSRRLNRVGHCPRCGYDLRATPERCPECGLGGDVREETQRHEDVETE